MKGRSATTEMPNIAINALHMAWNVNAGTATYLSNIIRPWYESADSGLHFTLICQAPPDWWIGDMGHFKLKVIPQGRRLAWRFPIEQLILPFTLYSKFDLIFHPGYIGSLLARVPQVVTIHDAFAWVRPKEVGKIKTIYWKTLIPAAAKRATQIIADTLVTASDISRYCSIPRDKIRVVHLAGGHLSRLSPDSEILSKLGIAGGEFFHCVGIFKDLKNPWNILSAYRHYRQTCGLERPKDLVMVGHIGGKGAKAIENEARHVPGVVIAGRISDNELAALYLNSAGLIFASLYEGFGLPILESQELGCPVITSNLSCMPEVAGKGAILADPSDVDEICKALIALDNGKPKMLVALGQENAESFSWTKASEETLSVLKGALQKRGRAK
jgi:glycosyltransferase involved in cell wall biosynthesis